MVLSCGKGGTFGDIPMNRSMAYTGQLEAPHIHHAPVHPPAHSVIR